MPDRSEWTKEDFAKEEFATLAREQEDAREQEEVNRRAQEAYKSGLVGEDKWFVVWERDTPARVIPGPVTSAALGPIYGNCTGPYTRDEAEEIVEKCLD